MEDTISEKIRQLQFTPEGSHQLKAAEWRLRAIELAIKVCKGNIYPPEKEIYELADRMMSYVVHGEHPIHKSPVRG